MTDFDSKQFWQQQGDEHRQTFEDTFKALHQPFDELSEACTYTITRGGKIILFGNGGSAADAQHLATEFTVRYIKDRDPIAAIALTTDTSALTAIGNDLGFDQLFARQIAALGKAQDIAIGISTSGTSENVLNGLKQAKNIGMMTAGLTGRDGGKMPALCDTLLIVPSNTTARIQEMHIMLGQMLCGALEIKLGLSQHNTLL